ncbi:IS66 family insertion sequence element accessory protein TnpA [Paenibacillus aceris]|uniref:IS66 family insertion sequence element accessory protein TnpA n=1 Tax=Paenibacillus aceris TaxID=869555 RepID=UPI003B849AE5
MTSTEREKLHHEWEARITGYRSSGLTLSAWCTANQCTINQLKYWLYKSKTVSP